MAVELFEQCFDVAIRSSDQGLGQTRWNLTTNTDLGQCIQHSQSTEMTSDMA